MLAGTVALQRLEPAHETIRVLRRLGRAGRHGGAPGFEERALHVQSFRQAVDVRTPIRPRQRRG